VKISVGRVRVDSPQTVPGEIEFLDQARGAHEYELHRARRYHMLGRLRNQEAGTRHAAEFGGAFHDQHAPPCFRQINAGH
jgi:hypothetical protein